MDLTAEGIRALLLGIDANTREWIRRINDFSAAETSDLVSHEPYLTPNRGGDVKGKLIKVSTVMILARLMCAQVVLRVLPSVWKEKIEALAVTPTQRFLARKIAETIIHELPSPKSIGKVLSEIFGIKKLEGEEKALEELIRQQVEGIRNSANGVWLPQDSKRKMKNIRSRHSGGRPTKLPPGQPPRGRPPKNPPKPSDAENT